ncbi:MAG: universal stress protein [Paracoccaceae bacterium]
MPLRCILAATDLSPRSTQVTQRAALLARRVDARLILAHVAEPESSGLSLFPLRGTRGPDIDRLHAEAAAIGAEVRLLDGEPAQALADLAAAEGATLMVLGLHRERRVLDVLRLTTMERIVLAAPCPVLVAHNRPVADYQQVLALCDFGDAAAEALRVAGHIAPQAQFHAIHALHLPLGAMLRTHSPEAEAAFAEAESLARGYLSRPGLPALAEPLDIVPGGVHQVLGFRRMELGADLVTIGAQSGRLAHELGHYARDLMRAPPTDLLVAKAAQNGA